MKRKPTYDTTDKNFLTGFFRNKTPKKSMVIAHRGAKSLAKVENTLESFGIAIKLNIKMIEFDVRKLKDNSLVIFHDPHIDNLSLDSLTYKELCEVTGKYSYTAPLLEEVLQYCSNRIFLDVELKESGYENEVIDLILRYYDENEFIITSFKDSVIKTIKHSYPKVKAGLLIGLEKANIFQRLTELFPFFRLKKTGADFVVPHYLLVTPILVAFCRLHNYGIFVWTVNKREIYKKLLKHRVTAIITDYPHRYSY